MNPFRQILDDTGSLLRDLRRGLHHVGWRLTWWRRRKEIQARRAASEAENVVRAVAASTKMCRECRALIPARAAVCPECGERTSHIRAGGLGRIAARVLPGEPTVSMIIMSACFLVFIAGLLVSTRLEAPPGGGTPGPLGALLNIDGRALVMTGANYGRLSGGPEPWRLLTAIFLHGGILHLAFNTWALITVGPLVEHLYAARKTFVLYLLSGVAGNLLSLWWHGPNLLGVGASGAIFGLIGLAAVHGFVRRDAFGEGLRRHMTQWAVYGLVMGVFLRADNAAHLGGLIAGAVAGYLVEADGVRRSRLLDWTWSALAFLGVLACAGSFFLIALRWGGAA